MLYFSLILFLAVQLQILLFQYQHIGEFFTNISRSLIFHRVVVQIEYLKIC